MHLTLNLKIWWTLTNFILKKKGTTLPSDNPLKVWEEINKWLLVRKQNQAITSTQYNLTKQTAKISAFSPETVGKYGFLIAKDVLPEKDLLEKTATIKRLEYSPLDSELKKQSGIAKKQYKGIDKDFISK